MTRSRKMQARESAPHRRQAYGARRLQPQLQQDLAKSVWATAGRQLVQTRRRHHHQQLAAQHDPLPAAAARSPPRGLRHMTTATMTAVRHQRGLVRPVRTPRLLAPRLLADSRGSPAAATQQARPDQHRAAVEHHAHAGLGRIRGPRARHAGRNEDVDYLVEQFKAVGSRTGRQRRLVHAGRAPGAHAGAGSTRA